MGHVVGKDVGHYYIAVSGHMFSGYVFIYRYNDGFTISDDGRSIIEEISGTRHSGGIYPYTERRTYALDK